GEPKISKVHENKWFFGVSEAERDASGAVIRVVVAIIDIDAFRASLKANFSLPGSTLALVSKSGQIYMRSEDHDKYVGRQLSRPSEASEIVRDANSGSFIVQSPLDGIQRMVAFHRLDDLSMYAVGTVSLRDVLLPWRERLALLAALWLALSAVASWFAYRLLKSVYEHEALAMTDGLTGVLNRRSLLSIVAGEERRANNDQQQAVLMVDVDHFKMINDNQGHVSGDAILRQVAQILRASCRDSDLVGRYGGEEFLIILDDTSIDGAMTLAEKLRATVTTISLPFGQVTVSIGVAVTCTFDNTLEGTIRRADQAMYVAKAAGRNRVILDDSSREGEPLIDQQI
ncbi:MAG: diguanylate cyclase, partial [Burkholderiales bacterium]|nr:diguanylate cyclase [Burkholderiales bacterium]